MGITNTIRQALETHVRDIDGLLPDADGNGGMVGEAAWENVDFTPEANQSYLRSILVMDTQRPVTRGPDPFILHEGNFLVGIHTPKDCAAKVADDAADLVRDAFPVRLGLTKDGVLVRFRWAERGFATLVAEHYSVEVSIRFYVHSQR